MTEEGRAEGAWIFLSHSHKDLEKVRRIRNALEVKGHNPLLFFLKCLSDDSELDDLIRREIEARTWFILCDSPNSRTSRWVQEEVEIIKSLEGKVYVEIDLDKDLDIQVERVTALSKRATVFISYSRADVGVAEALRAALREHDFRVLVDVVDVAPGEDWRGAMARAINEAVQKGFFLLLLSPEALESEFVRWEVKYGFDRQARSGRSNIIPIIVRDRDATWQALSPSGMDHLMALRYFDLTVGELAERIAALVTLLKTREME